MTCRGLVLNSGWGWGEVFSLSTEVGYKVNSYCVIYTVIGTKDIARKLDIIPVPTDHMAQTEVEQIIIKVHLL